MINETHLTFESRTHSNYQFLNFESIKNFLTQDSSSTIPRSVSQHLGQNQVLFDLQVPKGVPEDELNSAELVFYSFRKRTAITYINSFIKELNHFERTRPHLQFPLTKSPQLISGQITYDKNGDILKINTLRWSNITELQNFFMDVLKNMSSLPNPPKEIINENGEFVINFSLALNQTTISQ